MKIRKIAKIESGQDGAVWNDYLFRFDHAGHCFVYSLKELGAAGGEMCRPLSEFTLDRCGELKPHSNAVMFGKEYYSADDEFPLLYTNIYNNYAGADNPMKGTCLVYRLSRTGAEFLSTLVQIVEIGFVEDISLWSSDESSHDIRPYGNFTIDVESGIYYAFTMRDKTNTTRYFAFDLPKAADGITDGQYGVKRVTLNAEDIKKYFDCPYHRFVQGACFHKGKIYSTEGFTDSAENPPALRIIDVESKKQTMFFDFVENGLTVEPELIDFAGDVCYYADNHGNLYVIDF